MACAGRAEGPGNGWGRRASVVQAGAELGTNPHGEHAETDAQEDVGKGRGLMATRGEHEGLSSEGRERGEASQEADDDREAPVLSGGVGLCEDRGQEPHRQASGHVDEEGPERELFAEPSLAAQLDAPPAQATSSGPGKHQQHLCEHPV